MKTRHLFPLLLIVMALALSWSPLVPPSDALQPPSNPTVATAQLAVELAAASGQVADLKVLTRAGAQIGDVLVLEALPRDGLWAAEVAVKLGGRTLRYPVLLRRGALSGKPADCKLWQLQWTPSEEYAQALVNMLKANALPTSARADAPRWSGVQRLPAFPVIMTRAQMVTPFGAIDLGAPTGRAQDGGLPAAPTSSGLTPPEALTEHLGRWLQEVLQQDRGPAAIDIIADARVDWRQTISLVLGGASAGLFRPTLVALGTDGESLRAIEGTAPVRLSEDARPPELAVGLYNLGAERGLGLRLGYRNKVLPGPTATPCAEGMTACVQSPAQLAAAVEAALGAVEPLTAATVASHQGMTLQTLLPYLEALAPALGLEPRQLLWSYIQGAP